jgi:hypothetical protein
MLVFCLVGGETGMRRVSVPRMSCLIFRNTYLAHVLIVKDKKKINDTKVSLIDMQFLSTEILIKQSLVGAFSGCGIGITILVIYCL